MRWSRGRATQSGEETTRVLGVDPGTVAMGWGVVDGKGASLCRVNSGVVRPGGTRAERLATICRELLEICTHFAPAAVSLEQTFIGDNVQTAFRLGEARGAVMVAAAGAGLPVVEYAPSEIKVAIAGSGRAGKVQMQAMIGRLLGIEGKLAVDEADALGAAVCHLHAYRFEASVAASLAGGRPVRPRSARRR